MTLTARRRMLWVALFAFGLWTAESFSSTATTAFGSLWSRRCCCFQSSCYSGPTTSSAMVSNGQSTLSCFQQTSSHVYQAPFVSRTRPQQRPRSLSTTSSLALSSSNTNDGVDTSSDVVSIDWLEDDEDDVYDDDDDEDAEPLARTRLSSSSSSSSNDVKQAKTMSKWDQLNPKIRERIQRAGQERAMANKKKREPEGDKKRRQLMFVKERQREKKLAARVQRPVPLTDRTPLVAMIPGMNVTGICISHTAFGAYVDIGTECDGLLHIAQMSSDAFVSHPRQVVNPGDEIAVTVRSVNPSLKKLHLTMLPWDVVEEQLVREQQARAAAAAARSSGGGGVGAYHVEEDDRIPLTDIQVDDELWGELKRVTDFGAYVEVGAAVDGFLHFMDHPGFLDGSRRSVEPRRRHPTEFMQRGDRVRVWVSDVDLEQKRVKLTALRPTHLPGPRRDMQQYD